MNRIRVLITAPFLSTSGYGLHARTVLKALKSREDLFDLYGKNIRWGATGQINDEVIDKEEYEWLKFLENKTNYYTNNGGQFDLSIQVTVPNEIQRFAPNNILVTAGIEVHKISPIWVEKLLEVDKIIVPSTFAKEVIEKTSYQVQHRATGEINNNFKVNKPIDVIHYPVRQFKKVDVNLELKTNFNFLVVAQASPRKNLDNTISWFVEEFIDQDVGLIVKTNFANNSTTSKNKCEKALGTILAKYPNRKCQVYLLHGDMSDDEMHSLYQNPRIKCLVCLSHGEGFNLPAFESAYSGLPIIATDWSGHLDFLYKPVIKDGKLKNRPHFGKVDYDLGVVQENAVWEGMIERDAMWAYPQQGSYKMKLREVFKDHGRFKAMARDLQEWIKEEFTEKKIYSQYVESILEVCRPKFDDFEIIKF